jgi:hypothetical protein
MKEGVPLTLLLPNNTVVAELLEATFGAQTAATILLNYQNWAHKETVFDSF